MEFRLASGTEAERGRELIAALGWNQDDVGAGDPFVAMDDGIVVGSLRLLDAGERTTYVADVVVREDLRGGGIGSQMMRAAMATRAGDFYLVCHDERVAFYQRLGYADVAKAELPAEVVAAADAEGDLTSDHDHLHHFMHARPTG